MQNTKAKAGMIVLDGMDGAGKGVQSKRLVEAIKQQGHDVLLTREPGGSAGAEEIRRLLVEGEPDKWDAMTELMLMYAARRSHLRDTVWPALEQGSWVVSDRYADSSRAFQGIAGSLGLSAVEQVHQVVVGDFVPDLTIILDIEPEVSLARAAARGDGEDRFERKGMAYHEKVREAFRQIALADPHGHVLIDGSRSIEQVTSEIFRAIKEQLKLDLN